MAVNAGMYVGTAVVGALLANQQQPPQMPNLAPPPPPPQAEKMPAIQGIMGGLNGTGQAGGQKGPGQTFLTGSSGVDPNSLKLNKPTLLGE